MRRIKPGTRAVVAALVAAGGLHAGPSAALAENGMAASADTVRPLLAGAEIPSVTVRTATGEAIDLRELVDRQPTVLVFYRGGWCMYCNRQLEELRDVTQELEAIGYQVLALSPDRPAMLETAKGAAGAGYTLLSDSSLSAARAFGLAFTVDEETLKVYEGYGIDLEAASGQTHHGLPVPSVFVLDTEGVVQFSYANPNYKVRVDPRVVVAAARAARKEADK